MITFHSLNVESHRWQAPNQMPLHVIEGMLKANDRLAVEVSHAAQYCKLHSLWWCGTHQLRMLHMQQDMGDRAGQGGAGQGRAGI